MISYYALDLGAVHCSAVDCSAGSNKLLDNSADVGRYSSVNVGTDGFPVISYQGPSAGASNLSFVHCTAVDCSSYAAPIVLDSNAFAGKYTSLTIGTDGFPLISYAGGGARLSVVHCTAVDCSTSAAPVVLDSARQSLYTSVTIGADGLPIISYQANPGNSVLAFVHCTAVDCSTHSSPVVLDSAVGAGAYTAMTIGADGLPIISYQGVSGGNFNLSTVHCANILCAPPFVRRRR
jgi:hypothetical protein